jgi:dihydrolipoamide dehydrogenase
MGAYEVVVLGGGAAGMRVATAVAAGGRSVALVEAGLIGGESAYLACLPSNSLLESAARGETWEDAVARRGEVTRRLDDSAAEQRLAAAGVTVIRGTGRIASPGTVEVGTKSLAYSDLVLATGCEPVAPPIEGLADIPAWTTAEALCSPDLPRRLIVLGGGPAGCELTQIYATFGSQVTLVEAEPGLLPGETAFAGEMLAAALRRAGTEICLGWAAAKAERTSDGLTLALEDGTRIDADRLLLATGRRPRLGGLGLEALGLMVSPGMALPLTTTCRVAGTEDLPSGRVWAAGDVTGVTYTHTSQYQATVVAANILGGYREADYSAVPRCVFTTPSVFAVGIVPGKDEAAPDGARLVTVRAELGDTARARLGQDEPGRVELYADADTGLIAGAIAVGPDAVAWMAEVTLAIRARIPVSVLADVVHAFPSYGEALQGAFQEVRQLSELDMEAPEGDAIEQQQEVVSEQDETEDGEQFRLRHEVPFDVNEADAAEQDRDVGFDDDDYR